MSRVESKKSRVENKCRESRVKSQSRVESKKSRVIVESGQMSQEQKSRYIFNKICRRIRFLLGSCI